MLFICNVNINGPRVDLCGTPQTRRQPRRLLKTNLVVASGVVELAEGSLVAVGHVSTTTEEYQCTGVV